MNDRTRTAEANRLYWETDTSVAAIAERFDLSRRGLYEVVNPYPAGHPCPACGHGLLYENRSARRDSQAVCSECGARIAVDERVSAASAAVADLPSEQDLRADRRAVDDADDARRAELRGRAVLLGSAAIAGVALGTAAVLLARRRD